MGEDAKYLHYELEAGPDDTIEVQLDRQANVQLLDGEDYDKYRRGVAFDYYGGFATKSPVRLRAPRPGRWHLVIDLGGGAGTVKAVVRMLQGADAEGSRA